MHDFSPKLLPYTLILDGCGSPAGGTIFHKISFVVLFWGVIPDA